ncbi:MAG: DUF2007 domain-containing protein, partial [Pirellulaceae bacterium]|nr:DUF2007 domain-containing protein [Pirellulaceae bacterium]
MSETLCQVAAFTNVAEAEAARCRLESEGISARLDNATVVLWFWTWSQATGGVKLLVAADQVDDARRILAEGDSLPRGAKWTCAECGTEAPGEWEVCWQCGRPRDTADDAEERSPSESLSPENASPGMLETSAAADAPDAARDETPLGRFLGGIELIGVLLGVIVGLGFYLATGSLLVAMLCVLAWLFAAAASVSWARRAREGDTVAEEDAADEGQLSASETDRHGAAEPVLSAAEQSRERRRSAGSYFTRRAWRTAVLSLFLFAPLGFCAIALLVRINPNRMCLGRADRLRYY